MKMLQRIGLIPKKRLLVGLAICAVSIQAIMLFGRSITFQGDSGSYITYANMLKDSIDFSFFDIHRPPAYPLFVAGIFKIFGNNSSFGLRLVQHLVALGIIYFVYKIGKRLHDSFYFAWFAALVSCFSLQIWAYADAPMSELMYSFFITLSLMLTLSYWNTQSALQLFAACGSVGLATLVRPQGQYLVFLPILAFAVRTIRLRRMEGPDTAAKSKGTIRAAIVFVCALAAYSIFVFPWMYHNKQVHGVFSMGGAMGINLYSRLIDFDDLIVMESPALKKIIQTWELDRKTRLSQNVAIPANDNWRHHWPAAYAYMRTGNATLAQTDALMLDAAKDSLRVYYKEYLLETARIVWLHHNSYEPLYVYVPDGFDSFGNRKYYPMADISESSNKALKPDTYPGLNHFVINEPSTFVTPVYGRLAQAYHQIVAFNMPRVTYWQMAGYLSTLLLIVFSRKRAEWFFFLCFVIYGTVLPAFLVPASPRHRVAMDPALCLLMVAPLLVAYSSIAYFQKKQEQ